jgi:hypothetical protein
MKLSNFLKVQELVHLRAAYREQSQLVSEQCVVHLVVAVRGGSEKKTQPPGYLVQAMLRAAMTEIESQLLELGVEL